MYVLERRERKNRWHISFLYKINEIEGECIEMQEGERESERLSNSVKYSKNDWVKKWTKWHYND